MSNGKKENLFKYEFQVLEKSEELLKKDAITHTEYEVAFKELCNSYSELLDQTKLITKVSDKLQNKLNTVNEALEYKNVELRNTIDELTKARVGRKAQTIILILGLSLFIFEEMLIEPVIDRYTNNVWWAGLGIKLILALLLKPAESLLEGWLLKKAKNKKAAGTTAGVPVVAKMA